MQKDIIVLWDENNTRWIGKKLINDENISFVYNPSTKTWTSV